MIEIDFQIPQEIVDFIKDEKGQDVKTYIQNEVLNPIIEKYQKVYKEKRIKDIDVEVNKEINKIKKAFKIKISEEKK